MTRDTQPCPPPMPDGWEVVTTARGHAIYRGPVRIASTSPHGVIIRQAIWSHDELDALMTIVRHYTTRPLMTVRIEEI